MAGEFKIKTGLLLGPSPTQSVTSITDSSLFNYDSSTLASVNAIQNYVESNTYSRLYVDGSLNVKADTSYVDAKDASIDVSLNEIWIELGQLESSIGGIDSSLGDYVRKDGDTMSGDLAINASLSVIGNIDVSNALISNQSASSLTTGSNSVATISSSLYDAAFFDYVIKDTSSNMRAGTVFSTYVDSSVVYSDYSTTDIGNTEGLVFYVRVSAGNIILDASITVGTWTVKTLIRGL
jgi:hypothetical protein